MSRQVSIYCAWTMAFVFLAAVITLTVKAHARGSFYATPNPQESFFIAELSEGLFLNATKVKGVLDEGHEIILIKAYDSELKRPRLAAARLVGGHVTEIEAGWFQPSLVYLMEQERIVIRKTSKNQISVSGINIDTLTWMARQ